MSGNIPIRFQDSLNLYKNLRDQVGFLLEDKYQSFLLVGSIAITGCGQTCPEYPK